jgi:hypothetical protein
VYGGTDATLKLDHPPAMTGPIAGLVVGDIIDLAQTIVTSASLVGSTLTVTQVAGPTLTYQVGGRLPVPFSQSKATERAAPT